MNAMERGSEVRQLSNLNGKRILFVVNVDWFFLSHRLPIAHGAKAAGAEVWVAAADTGRSAEIEDSGFQFLPLPLTRGSGGIGREFATLVALFKLYRLVKPDIVHHVTVKPVLYGSLITAAYRIPTINAISGFGYAMGSEGGKILSKLVKSGYRLLLRSPRAYTIFQNEEDRTEFTSQGFVRPERAVLIRGSGVDCDVFHPSSSEPKEKTVMFASRMLREKGVEQFVGLAQAVRARDPRVRFVLVGQPDESPTSVTAEQLIEWDRQGWVEWWGHSDSMARVLREATLFVLPTYYREGLPKVLLEAAASGLPIVTTNIPGCRDIVEDRVTGRLVTVKDQDELTQVVLELLSDASSRCQYGEKARMVALKHFSVEGVVEKTLSLYLSLLDEACRP